MDFQSILKELKIPFGVFDLNGCLLASNPSMKELEKNYGDLLTFFEIDTKNSALKSGMIIEKPVFLNNKRKIFGFFVQKVEDFLVIVGIDITYNHELIDAVIGRSNLVFNMLSSIKLGFYIKEVDGGFVYKNLFFERFLEFVDYPDSSFLNLLVEKETVVNLRTINDNSSYFLELATLYEYHGRKYVCGIVLFDKYFSNFISKLKERESLFSNILNTFSCGVLYLAKDSLSLQYFNEYTRKVLTDERINRIKILGFFEPGVLFDENTLRFIEEEISLKGRCEILNYKIPNLDGEYDFDFIVNEEKAVIVFFKKVLPDEEQKAYRQFRNMFEYASDAIFLLKDTLFVECNKKAEEILNCSKEDIIGKTPAFFSPEFQPNGMPSVEAGIKMLDSANIEGNKVFEWVHRRCDGSLFNAEVTLSKIQIGGYTYTQAIVRDISSRKNLIDLGKGFSILLNSTFPVFVFDNEFKLVLKNDIDLPLNIEDIKRFTISVLTKKAYISPNNYNGIVKAGNFQYEWNVTILYENGKKFFLVKVKEAKV